MQMDEEVAEVILSSLKVAEEGSEGNKYVTNWLTYDKARKRLMLELEWYYPDLTEKYFPGR